MRWRDRVIGVVLGLILGVGIVTGFVFIYSEETVDAPSISGEGGDGEARGAGQSSGSPPPVATVRVIDGVPPASGPAELHYRRDEVVRLRVVSDGTVGVELMGYGIDRTIAAGEPALIRFKASKPGSFPLVVAASLIDIATITRRRPFRLTADLPGLLRPREGSRRAGGRAPQTGRRVPGPRLCAR